MKAREAAEQAEADAEASAKERARSEIERISREAEEAQKKSDAELKAKQETERLETLRAAKAAEEARQAAIKAAAALEQERIKVETERLEKQAATEQEKLAKQRQDQEKLEKEKADKEKAHLEIASVLRKAEDDRKNAVERAKAEKLEAKRQAKAEQEASLQAERQAKLEAKAHAKALKLAQQAEEKAKLDASENAKREVARIAKEAEIARAEALQLAKQTADALSLKTKATNEKIESELENTALLHSHTVQVAHAKLAVEEQANIQAKQNAQLEMARIAREADIARQDAAAEMQKNTTDETGKETENKSYFHLDDFDAAEAAEEAAFQAEEQAEAEKKHQPIVSKIDIKIEKTAKQSSEDAGRADIKNAAIAQADIVASMQTNAKSYVSAKKLKLWLANISKLVLIYVPLLALVLLAILHFVNISALIAPIERLASDSTGQPVAIKKVHASLWPQPHFVLEDVAIGNNNIKAVHVLPTASSLFEEVKVVKSLVIEGLNIEQADFNQPLAWASNIRQAKNLKIEQINLKNLTLSIRDLELESFDGKVTLTDAGALNMLALVSSNNALSVTIAPQGDNYEITLKAANWALPFNQKIMFSNLNAKGLASANLLKFSQIDGEIYGGNVTGQANIQWPAGAAKWASSGDFKLTNANAAQLLTTFGSAVEIGGKLTLTANFSNKAITANKLAALSLISGNFDIRQGGINGVELARAVANRGSQSLAGDTTSFDKLTGSVKVNQQQYQFGKLVLASPQFNANGFININANQALTGRVNADLATQSRRLQANFAISGRGKDLKSN